MKSKILLMETKFHYSHKRYIMNGDKDSQKWHENDYRMMC